LLTEPDTATTGRTSKLCRGDLGRDRHAVRHQKKVNQIARR
jgi:hypothetical protein